MDNHKKCQHVGKNGKTCGMWAMRKSTLCFNHNPETQAKKLAASKNGGAAKEITLEKPLEKVDVNNPKDITVLLSKTIVEVRGGDLDPRIASVIGYLAGILLRAYEVSDLELKIKQINDVMLYRKTTIEKG